MGIWWTHSVSSADGVGGGEADSMGTSASSPS